MVATIGGPWTWEECDLYSDSKGKNFATVAILKDGDSSRDRKKEEIVASALRCHPLPTIEIFRVARGLAWSPFR